MMVVLDHHNVLEGNSGGNNGSSSSESLLRKPSPLLAFSGVSAATTAAGSILQRNAVLNTPALQSSSPYIQPLPADSEVRTIMWSIIFN